MQDWLLAPDAARSFLRECWQQQAKFLPGALAEPPQVDWRALAARDDVESRRVVTTDDGTYRLEHGPFEARQLQAARDGHAPDAPWTVLLQDADQFVPPLRALLKRFRFLPDWRVEDVMVSFATRGASVGPHVDAYDVFLIQADGQRHWQVGTPGSAVPLKSHEDGLRLVDTFDAALDIVAQPGDVLYLPPGVPHHGVARSDCVTLSVGFRAPSGIELAAALLDDCGGADRYADPPLSPPEHPALIDDAAIAAASELLRATIDLSSAAVARTLGRLVTEPKDWFLPDPPDADSTAGDVAARMAAGNAELRLHHGSRVALTQTPALLFVNGDALPLAPPCLPLAHALCRARLLTVETLRAAARDPAGTALLAELLNAGAVYWHDAV